MMTVMMISSPLGFNAPAAHLIRCFVITVRRPYDARGCVSMVDGNTSELDQQLTAGSPALDYNIPPARVFRTGRYVIRTWTVVGASEVYYAVTVRDSALQKQ